MRVERTGSEAEVWRCLDHVIDPELDEPVTTMGFVESVTVDRDRQSVEVKFRLPTYWCSPNFAFLMAFDMRLEIEKIPWVRDINIQLKDHCFGDRINDGVNGSLEFSAVFAEYCNGEDLDAVRAKFQEKAFIRRQESVLVALKKQGVSAADIVAMTLDMFDTLTFNDDEAERQKPRYRSLLLSRGLAKNGGDLAFVTWCGQSVSVDGLTHYLSQARGVRINMEFNSALCRGLKDARYKEVKIDTVGPVPIKFIRDAVIPSDVRGS